jgi:DNA-binding transcriptional ArsR family regulator
VHDRASSLSGSAFRPSLSDSGIADDRIHTLTSQIENIGDPRYVRALGHPLRVRILAILEERTASAVEISRMLQADIGVVAYHVRKLHQLGLIELERETRVRGAIQRHYRAYERPRVSDDAWEQAPPVAKQAAVDAALQQIYDYGRASNAAGGFDRRDAHITRTALRLDAEGWDKLARSLRRVLEEVAEIEREVAARGAAGEAELEDVGLVLMQFQALPFSRSGQRPRHDDA